MRRLFAVLAVVWATNVWGQSPEGRTTIALDGHNFTVPAGFTVERAAGTPLIERPIVADFDEQGRLYIAEAGGAIEKPDIAAQKKAHRVVRLEDFDGDGKFDKSVVYADQVAFPEGAMWLAGSLYVAAPPQIWKFTDGDGDGVAEKREVWFDGKTVTGCANDLHGPYLGPDGWIYWAKGAFAAGIYAAKREAVFDAGVAHFFRARPDGTGIEPVMTGGMDNPVDVVFTPGGERIFSTTFFQRPANGLRDGLIHAVYGGIYGKDQDAIYEPEHKWTSPELMPVLVHHGPSAPCGLHRLESDQFGPEYQDNVFSCQFNLRKVSRHVLKPSGAMFTTEDSDLIVSDNTDFHPTDVIEDADGSLLVLNTGGWYKLCCPSSQLVKADVLGGIYRVKKVGSHKMIDPRGRTVPWKSLTAVDLALFFDDSRPFVRRRAAYQMAERSREERQSFFAEVAASVIQKPTERQLLTAIQVSSIAGEQWGLLWPQVRSSSSDTVRQAAIHAASVQRDKRPVNQLIGLLSAPSLANRRAAAEALGRIGDSQAVPAILKALADSRNDRALDHSLTYALIEIGDEASLRPSLSSEQPNVRRAALVALDQIGAQLDAELVIARLDDPNESLRNSARWIAGRHAEWGQQLVAYLRPRLSGSPNEAEQTALAELLAKLAKSEAVQQLVADTIRDGEKSPVGARVAMRAIAASALKELPAGWLTALAQSLTADSPVLTELLAAIRAIPPAKADAGRLAEALIRFGDSTAPAPIRLTALVSIPGGLKTVTDNHFALLMGFIDREQPAEQRGMAADVLAKSKLKSEQLKQLANRLARVSPMELDRLLGAFVQSTEDSVGLQLIAALDQPALRAALSAESVKQRLAKYGQAVQSEAQMLCAKIDAEHGQQGAQLEATFASLPAGDIRRGQAVFNSTKTSCRACHTIGYVGGRIGPDLTRIAQIRQPRELLESVLYPSASFVRHYEPLLVRMLDGQVHSGIVKSETSAEVVLTLAADKEVRLAREEIDEIQPGKVSVMPAGLEKQLSLQDLADLVEFLKNCK